MLPDPISPIAAPDRGYAPAAYPFVCQALDHTLQMIGERRHVTGKELLEGIRDLAEKAFGFLARTVFEEWGIRTTEDFGRIVFRLVESRVLSRTDDDRIEHFRDIFDFRAVFEDGCKIPIRFDPDAWRTEYAGLPKRERAPEEAPKGKASPA